MHFLFDHLAYLVGQVVVLRDTKLAGNAGQLGIDCNTQTADRRVCF